MKILLNHNIPLHLERDFEISIEKTNPLLSEQGSASLPLKLPISKSNLRELGYPDRLDRLYNLKKKTPVLIESGVMRKQATLELMSYQGNEGIESVLLLDEAEMYTKMQEISLPSIFKTVRKAEDIQLSGNFATPLDKLIKYLELVYRNQIQDDFRLFTVATDHQTYIVKGDRLNKEHEAVFYNGLNMCKEPTSRADNSVYDTDLNGKLYTVFHGRTENEIMIGSEIHDVPKGYGITPFLKENYVLREIFRYFGYELSPSILDTDPDLSLLVLVNNTADAIVKGRIEYSQLVPTCTIHEYLQTVRTRFGCEFYVTEDHKRIVPIFWRDILRSTPKKSFTDKISGEPIIEFSTPKLMKLCYKRNLEFADMSADTIEKFENMYGKITGILEKTPSRTTLPNGFYIIQSIRSIIEYYTYYDEGLGRNRQGERFVMRPMFDYYTEGNDVEYEEPDSNIEFMAEFNASVDCIEKGTDKSRSPVHFGKRWILFIGERRHMNTTLKTTVTDEKGNTETKEKEESAGSCPIMAAYARESSSSISAAITYGTMFCYDHIGNKVGNIDLTFGGENGLYKHFWQDRDRMLQHSNLKVTVDIHLNEIDIMNFRMDELVLIDGQFYIPEKLQYSIRKDKMETHQAEFRTVRLYHDPE